MRKTTLIAVLSACLIVATTVTAAPRAVPIAQDLTALGWKSVAFDGIPVTHYAGTKDGVLEVRADQSSSVLYQTIDDGPKTPATLSWSWQVIDALPATDLSKTDGDDRVLAVHVGFADDSFMARLKGMASPFAQGHVLTYVWGNAEIASFPHPHLPDNGFMIVRRTADTPSHEWFQENIDLAADYQRAFGTPPPPVAFIGISGDADDTARTSFGKIKDIALN